MKNFEANLIKIWAVIDANGNILSGSKWTEIRAEIVATALNDFMPSNAPHLVTLIYVQKEDLV